MSKLFIILLILSPLFQPITKNNVAQLKEVKRIGKGVFTGALATSPDGETLAVGVQSGCQISEVIPSAIMWCSSGIL
jgi:hypothetical protein